MFSTWCTLSYAAVYTCSNELELTDLSDIMIWLVWTGIAGTSQDKVKTKTIVLDKVRFGQLTISIWYAPVRIKNSVSKRELIYAQPKFISMPQSNPMPFSSSIFILSFLTPCSMSDMTRVERRLHVNIILRRSVIEVARKGFEKSTMTCFC